MHVGEICTRSVVTCAADLKVVELAQLMRDHHVTDVLVVEQREDRPMPLGIVTFRDMVVRVLANRVDPETCRARDVMSDCLETVLDGEFIYDAIWHMRAKRVRRLPVLDARGALIGVLTADDVAEFLAAELVEVARISPSRSALERETSAPGRR